MRGESIRYQRIHKRMWVEGGLSDDKTTHANHIYKSSLMCETLYELNTSSSSEHLETFCGY